MKMSQWNSAVQLYSTKNIKNIHKKHMKNVKKMKKCKNCPDLFEKVVRISLKITFTIYNLNGS
jgi:hypothetical protein